MLTLLFKFLSFYSAGTESGREEKNSVSPQKRKQEISEKDKDEPKEKKAFSMSLGTKPQAKSAINLAVGGKKSLSIGETNKEISIDTKGSIGKPTPIKMSLTTQSKETPVAVKPICGKVASVFNDDSEDEEEMPPEAKMKMRNVGRDTPTAAGPNSYGKNNLGFCDRNKIIERELQQKLLELSDDK